MIVLVIHKKKNFSETQFFSPHIAMDRHQNSDYFYDNEIYTSCCCMIKASYPYVGRRAVGEVSPWGGLSKGSYPVFT